MRIRSVTLLIVILTLFCAIACVKQTGPLRATAGNQQVVLAAADVEEIYLKYDRNDQRYIAVIALNAAGKDRLGRLLRTGSGNEVSLFVGNRFLTKVPIMTKQIDRLLVKVADRQSAIDLLKDLSN